MNKTSNALMAGNMQEYLLEKCAFDDWEKKAIKKFNTRQKAYNEDIKNMQDFSDFKNIKKPSYEPIHKGDNLSWVEEEENKKGFEWFKNRQKDASRIVPIPNRNLEIGKIKGILENIQKNKQMDLDIPDNPDTHEVPSITTLEDPSISNSKLFQRDQAAKDVVNVPYNRWSQKKLASTHPHFFGNKKPKMTGDFSIYSEDRLNRILSNPRLSAMPNEMQLGVIDSALARNNRLRAKDSSKALTDEEVYNAEVEKLIKNPEAMPVFTTNSYYSKTPTTTVKTNTSEQVKKKEDPPADWWTTNITPLWNDVQKSPIGDWAIQNWQISIPLGLILGKYLYNMVSSSFATPRYNPYMPQGY